MLMLLSAQVLEEIQENLFEAENKNFNLIQKKKNFCFTIVVGCSMVDNDLNMGCSLFLNECSSNAGFVSPIKKWIKFYFIQNIYLPFIGNLNGLLTIGVDGALYIKIWFLINNKKIYITNRL